MGTEYEQGFKEEALKLSDEIGLAATADKLGIPYNTLSSWRCKRKHYGNSTFVGSGRVRVEPGHEREVQLEKENAELKRANDILKEALSFFVNDRKK
jgi:transposase